MLPSPLGWKHSAALAMKHQPGMKRKNLARILSRRACTAFLPLTILFTNGCAIIGLRQQDIAIDKTGSIVAEASGFTQSAPIYGLLLSGEGAPAGGRQVGNDGLVIFAAPLASTYDIFIFADANGNRRFDLGEQAALGEGIRPVPLDAPQLHSSLHRLRPGNVPASLVGTMVPSRAGDAIPLALGEVASIKEHRFAPRIGENGLWKPETSLLSDNFGLFFTEPCDPSRMPVVFVHGIGGSPRDFSRLIPALDRSRYQAWFFAYPSGFRLGKASTTLAVMLDLAMTEYGVKKIDVVAHSMGGLVARDAILKLSRMTGDAPVARFVSISTPWEGHSAAEQGIRALKYPVPSWIDMAPGSAFLKNLWKQPLPSGTRHYLIAGFDTRQLPWLTLNNDTVINLRSSFFIPAQEESTRIFALPYSHEEILAVPVTARKMNLYLTEP